MKDDREKLIVATLDKIRHFLQRDGGDVEFVSFVDGVVYVRLHGACQDCAYAAERELEFPAETHSELHRGT